MRRYGWLFPVTILGVLILSARDNTPPELPTPTVAEACQRKFGAEGEYKVKECETFAQQERYLQYKQREIDAMRDIANTAR